ncbi:MAG TPA: PAS domain-containing protein, partial [archaeon]|nr:PAS domain-containing protein [archaeon]
MNKSQNNTSVKVAPEMLDCCSLIALEHIQSGVLAVDRKGEIIVFNQAAEMITGFRRDEVLGYSFKELPFNIPGENGDLLSQVLSGTDVAELRTEKLLGCKNGGKVLVESLVKPLQDGMGEMLGAVEIFNDLSAIQELKDEVFKSRTLSALG